jgi:hypothetical protein
MAFGWLFHKRYPRLIAGCGAGPSDKRGSHERRQGHSEGGALCLSGTEEAGRPRGKRTPLPLGTRQQAQQFQPDDRLQHIAQVLSQGETLPHEGRRSRVVALRPCHVAQAVAARLALRSCVQEPDQGLCDIVSEGVGCLRRQHLAGGVGAIVV